MPMCNLLCTPARRTEVVDYLGEARRALSSFCRAPIQGRAHGESNLHFMMALVLLFEVPVTCAMSNCNSHVGANVQEALSHAKPSVM